jgi:Tol biopolymer transport system component
LEHPGEIVGREELCRALWPSDTFVDFDHSLNTAVKKLRDALGDLAGAPIYIETIPKRGYRFVAPVLSTEGVSPASRSTSSNGEFAPQSHPSTPPGDRHVPRGDPPVESQRSSSELRPSSNTRGYWYGAIAISLVVVVVALALQEYWRPQHVARLVQEKRITANAAEAPIRAAVVSPDGKYLAYADTTGMYLRQIDNGEIHSLPLPKGFAATPSSWFPDGTHLLLTSRDRPGQKASIWKYSVLGGVPEMLIDDGEDGVVSPDGSQIAFFHRSAPALFGLRANPILHVIGELWIASSDGQNPHQFVVPGASDQSQMVGAEVTAVSWAPDNRRLAYIERHKAIAHSRIGDQSWILTRDLNGGRPQVILKDHQLAPEDLCWARDGRLLYALRAERGSPGGNYDLEAIRIDSESGAASGSPQRVSSGLGWIGGITISADGKRVLLWRGNALPQVFVSEFDQNRNVLSAPRRLTLDESPNQPVAWMPDSRTVLFASTRSGKTKLYKQRVDQVIGEVALERSASARITSDGSELLFAEEPDSEDPSALVRLLRTPINGGATTLVLQDAGIDNFSCSKTSVCVYSKVIWRTTVLITFDCQKGKGKEIARFDGWPSWALSPDGSQLAVVADRNRGLIQLISTKTGAKRDLLLQEWPVIMSVHWTADNRGLLLTSFSSRGVSAVLHTNLQGATRVLLESTPNAQVYWAIPSPDGHYVALNIITGEENVWMVENF